MPLPDLVKDDLKISEMRHSIQLLKALTPCCEMRVAAFGHKYVLACIYSIEDESDIADMRQRLRRSDACETAEVLCIRENERCGSVEYRQ